jgi:hypothetical protein
MDCTEGAHEIQVILDDQDVVDETYEGKNVRTETLGTKTQVTTEISINLTPDSVPPTISTFVLLHGARAQQLCSNTRVYQ